MRRSSLGVYRGTKPYACERWQAGEPLGFTLTGHGAGVQEQGSWEMQLDKEARVSS